MRRWYRLYKKKKVYIWRLEREEERTYNLLDQGEGIHEVQGHCVLHTKLQQPLKSKNNVYHTFTECNMKIFNYLNSWMCWNLEGWLKDNSTYPKLFPIEQWCALLNLLIPYLTKKRERDERGRILARYKKILSFESTVIVIYANLIRH